MAEPYLCPSRESAVFAAAEGGGTPVGTRAVETFSFRNAGVKDLVVTSVTRTGPSVFALSAAWSFVGSNAVPCEQKTCTPADVDAARDAYIELLRRVDAGVWVPDGGLLFGGPCGEGRACVTTSTGAQCKAEPCECSCGIVKGRQRFFVQVDFVPTELRSYAGDFTVNSNARETPNRLIKFTGCGAARDGGSSPCFDAGTP